MGMTKGKAKKMLKAKLECLKNETSGINHDCNMRLCDGCSLNYEQGNMGEQKEALDLAIKALDQTRWIPVSERLPELGERVLCQCQANIYEVLKLTVDGWYYNPNHCYMESFVIAWMPLPEAYKEGEE